MLSTSNQKVDEEERLHESKDRISNLSKSLIGHILSFLPTKYAVRTSILSSIWKQMWMSINNLDFDALGAFNYGKDALSPNVQELDIDIRLGLSSSLPADLLTCGKLMTLERYSYRLKLTVFPCMTSLKLGVERDVDWRALLDIRESSPNLRTLIFEEVGYGVLNC
ncbi:hypothetical protein RHGRI_003755 [Rhododendron griersonianum]|uniref:F-box domain-containing protein n=1 Tax=Rhododendron griersonianum TaxID=479676 RepID=A0AAV6L6Z1_9ERIC|nr:hypothetical protein RHGRI_003755 [Rhododendron griersonianum]